jgi:small subunit ribosomal protein S1
MSDQEKKVVENVEQQETKEVAAETTAKTTDVKSNEPVEFDWDSLNTKVDIYSKADRSKLEGLYTKSLSSINEHEVIEGEVVSLSSREVVVNIGYKSDGVIPKNEFRYNPELKPGDKVDIYVEVQEDSSGQMVLSHKKARILKSWDRINEAFDKDEVITGFVKSRTKGGLIVDVFGIEAFLPGSQIDVKPIRDYDVFVNKSMEFKVVKINHEYKNVVVSHKALIEDELEAQRAEIISKLEKGQVLEGIVKNITSYGVFIDLGGVDGLVHITDLSWGRISHPEEVVELDQKIKVVILDFDDNKKRIALGLKQLTPHPWDSLDESMKVGDKVGGKVVVLADYGAFIEIAPGIEGLIHVSEMSWSQHLRTAQDFLKVGQELEACILTLDREERKMSLGMKQLIPDPWENIAEKYPVSSKHSAKVRNFTNFGIFVEIEEGVDGLIHISDLSWSKKIKHPAEFTKVGDMIDVVVLDVDQDNRRLSLGHKQLEENPWDVFETVFGVESIHQGTVTNMGEKGALVSLPYGVEGFAPKRHLNKEDGSQVKVDEIIDFKVIEFSKDNKKIILSHSRIFEEEVKTAKFNAKVKASEQAKSAKRSVKNVNEKLEKTTLGDLDVLANLKSSLEKEEKAKK